MDHGWMIYIFLTIICWGVWTFLPKIAIRTISAESALILEVLGGAFWGLIVFGFIKLEFHLIGTFCALVAGFCSYFGAYYYFKSVKLNPVGLVSSISSLYPVVAVALSILFLGERASLRRIVGIVLAIIAIYLMNLPRIEKRDCQKESRAQSEASPPEMGMEDGE